MGLETYNFIDSFVPTNPTNGDPASQGDDHIRGIKYSIKLTFQNVTGAVTKTHTELNSVTDRGLIDGQTWTGMHAFPSTTYGVTAAFGASGTGFATLDFVNAVATNAALPGQTGNAGRYLQTNGTTATWSQLKLKRNQRTSNTILVAGNSGEFFDVTSGTFSQTLDPAATLGADWYAIYKNSGSGVVTIDPSGAETINGAASLALRTGECYIIQCNATNFSAIKISGCTRVDTYIASGTFTPESGRDYFVEVVSGGGGGGSGAKGTAPSGTGGQGGIGGNRNTLRYRSGSTVAVPITIGAGGAGGAPITASTTNGNAGSNGGTSSFGLLLMSTGGVGGIGGSASSEGGASSVGNAASSLAGASGSAGGTSANPAGSVGAAAGANAGGAVAAVGVTGGSGTSATEDFFLFGSSGASGTATNSATNAGGAGPGAGYGTGGSGGGGSGGAGNSGAGASGTQGYVRIYHLN